MEQIIKVIEKLQKAYEDRNIKEVDSFMKEAFTCDEGMTIMGTSSDEFFCGYEGVKELLVGDWEGWGDLKLDVTGVEIQEFEKTAVFFLPATVKYSFEHSEERDERYVDYIKSVLDNDKMTKTQRLNFSNWVLTLNFHRHKGNPRDYQWPVSVVGLVEKSSWKISNMFFSMPPSVYPDERVENDQEHLEDYKTLLESIHERSNRQDHKKFSSSLVDLFKVGATDGMAFYDAKGQKGRDLPKGLKLERDIIISKNLGDVSWVNFWGLQEKEETLDLSEEKAMEDIHAIMESENLSEDKLFQIHRRIAYQLKESAIGKAYTHPFRGVAIMTDDKEHVKVPLMHIAYPFYWIMEGKL